MKWFLIGWIMVVPSALAGPVEDHARPCLRERLDFARAACIGVIVDQRLARVEARITAATADLQAASARELWAFQRGLDRAQKRWRNRMLTTCRAYAGKDKVAYETCRLDQVIARDAAVRTALNDARAGMGMTPLIEVPEDVEVLIPLPGAPAGPGADVRLPLTIPIRP